MKTFFVFLGLQVCVMVILRRKLVMVMFEDIQQSKGLLNLVPDKFFEDNQQEVEKLIRALQN